MTVKYDPRVEWAREDIEAKHKSNRPLADAFFALVERERMSNYENAFEDVNR